MSLIIGGLGASAFLAFLVFCQKWTCHSRIVAERNFPWDDLSKFPSKRYGNSAGVRRILEQDSEQGSGRSSCLIEELGGVVMGVYSRALLQPVRKACCVDAGLVVPSKSPLFMLDVVEGSVSQETLL